MKQQSSASLATHATAPSFTISLETEAHHQTIERLHETVFGPGRFTRAAFRVREQGSHDPELSFVATQPDGKMIGSVRLTWVTTSVSRSKGLLLGPLCVVPNLQKQGVGKALVAKCVEAAKQVNADYLMLVGDQPYYGPLGFDVVAKRNVLMPGPVDLNRLLVCPLGGFDPSGMAGLISHSDILPN
ncbi:N-acetyltransferase [Ahrensia kielensis]|uniref:N-acetyltransferase n=1 Tax=Ahrensia kielensis TaxID=76980 RepID=A0ABU9T727_9HYPH